jgi:hypothetical protein
MISWSDHVAPVVRKRNEDNVFVQKVEEKRPRRRWKDTMKMVGNRM